MVFSRDTRANMFDVQQARVRHVESSDGSAEAERAEFTRQTTDQEGLKMIPRIVGVAVAMLLAVAKRMAQGA